MIPGTVYNMNAPTCISAMQKVDQARHGKEAMELACELMHTSSTFTRWFAIGCW
jgi:hypothetical protein